MQNDDKLTALQTLAAERRARLYVRKKQYRLLYPGNTPTLYIFGGLSQVEAFLNTPGAAAINNDLQPERPEVSRKPEPREMFVEMPRYMQRLTSRVGRR
jgi:hypothetical protein